MKVSISFWDVWIFFSVLLLIMGVEDECWGWMLRVNVEYECWGWMLRVSVEGECWGWILRVNDEGECWGWMLRMTNDRTLAWKRLEAWAIWWNRWFILNKFAENMETIWPRFMRRKLWKGMLEMIFWVYFIYLIFFFRKSNFSHKIFNCWLQPIIIQRFSKIVFLD